MTEYMIHYGTQQRWYTVRIQLEVTVTEEYTTNFGYKEEYTKPRTWIWIVEPTTVERTQQQREHVFYGWNANAERRWAEQRITEQTLLTNFYCAIKGRG